MSIEIGIFIEGTVLKNCI